MKFTKLTQQANQKSLACYPLLAPIVRYEGPTCRKFPSKHLSKNYIFKHSTFYTKDTTKRENILPLLPNSLNLLLVIL